MIRTAGKRTDGTPFVWLGLDPQNMDRLREGQPIKVNLRHLDPDGPPVEQLPELEVVIFFAGTDEMQAVEKVISDAAAGGSNHRQSERDNQ